MTEVQRDGNAVSRIAKRNTKDSYCLQEPVGTGSILNGRYLLEERLGEGGMGVVFKALDLRKEEAHAEDAYVAIKMLNDRVRLMVGAAIALQREAMIAQSLKHHGIATIYDYDRDQSHPYIVMEWVEGFTLDQVMITDYPDGLPRKQAFLLIQQLVDAVQYAHKKRIVHADIKPSNIKVLQTGQPILLDFGLARLIGLANLDSADHLHDGAESPATKMLSAADVSGTPDLKAAMTPSYATLSRLRGSDPTESDDIYALGCVIYLILTGRHPHQRGIISHIHARNTAKKNSELQNTKYKGTELKSKESRDAQPKSAVPKRPAGLTKKQWSVLKKTIDPHIKLEGQLTTQLADQFSPKIRGINNRKRGAASLLIAALLLATTVSVGNWFRTDFVIWKLRYAEESKQVSLLTEIVRQIDTDELQSTAGALERIYLPGLIESREALWSRSEGRQLFEEVYAFQSNASNSLEVDVEGGREGGDDDLVASTVGRRISDLNQDVTLVTQLASLLPHSAQFISLNVKVKTIQAEFITVVLNHYDRLLSDYISGVVTANPRSENRFLNKADSEQFALKNSSLFHLIRRDYEWLKRVDGPYHEIQRDPRLRALFDGELTLMQRTGRYSEMITATEVALSIFPNDPRFLLLMNEANLKRQTTSGPLNDHASAEVNMSANDQFDSPPERLVTPEPLSPVYAFVIVELVKAMLYASSNKLDVNPSDRDRYVQVKNRYLFHGGSEPGWQSLVEKATLKYADELAKEGRVDEAYGTIRDRRWM